MSYYIETYNETFWSKLGEFVSYMVSVLHRVRLELSGTSETWKKNEWKIWVHVTINLGVRLDRRIYDCIWTESPPNKLTLTYESQVCFHFVEKWRPCMTVKKENTHIFIYVWSKMFDFCKSYFLLKYYLFSKSIYIQGSYHALLEDHNSCRQTISIDLK